MKITIELNNTKEAQDAYAFLGRALGAITETVVEDVSRLEGVELNMPPSKTRKPRADAGQKREPYGPRTPTTGEPVALEPGQGSASTPTPQPVAPAAPTISSAPQTSQGGAPLTAPTGGTATGGAAPAVAEFPATLEGARAVMKKLNDTKGKGMDACIAALKAHGVNRISDLPKEKFGEFVKYVLSQIPAVK